MFHGKVAALLRLEIIFSMCILCEKNLISMLKIFVDLLLHLRNDLLSLYTSETSIDEIILHVHNH